MAVYLRLRRRGNLEMGVGFDTKTEEIAEELLWSIVSVCTTVAVCLVSVALYSAYLVGITAYLVALNLSRYFKSLLTGDLAEAPDANERAYWHALVFQLITSGVVTFSLPMAFFAIDVLLYAYQFWRNARQGEQEPRVGAEACLHIGTHYFAFLVGVSAYVLAKYVETGYVMQLSFGSALVFWIVASGLMKGPFTVASGLVKISLSVAWYAVDALFLAYAMWVNLWQRCLEPETMVITYRNVVMANRTVVLATYTDPEVERQTGSFEAAVMQLPDWRILRRQLEMFPEIL